jgi:hypothetical protein
MSKNKTLIEASKEMYEKTMKQAKENGKKVLNDVKGIYHNQSILALEFEPKKTNRWLLEFPKGSNIDNWICKAVTLPVYPFDTDNDISVTLYDPLANSTTNNILNFVKKGKPFKLKINILDPTSVVVEKWVLKGCIIKRIDCPPLDYSTDEPMLVHLQISYNEVKYKTQ